MDILMSVDYQLTIAGTTDYHAVSQRAFPDLLSRLVEVRTEYREGQDGDFYADLGVGVAVSKYDKREVEADSGTGPWTWSPVGCVGIIFDIDKAQLELAALSSAQAVARVLGTGQEDVAFVLNAGILLLTRIDGEVRKYHRDDWWTVYQGLDALIAD
jgi:hypothetical protein